MCRLTRTKTIEQIIQEKSAGMTDEQKALYWYELCKLTFNLLGKVEAELFHITAQEWLQTALATYPTLTDVKIPDSDFYIPTEAGLQDILSRDWTNLVPYIAQISDCDDFGVRLYDHLTTYYKVTGVLPIWGDTDEGYHGFDLAVLWSPTGLYARLVEPQTDSIFEKTGPLGLYIPRETAVELGIKRKTVPAVAR
jgi:hypothetical protein